MNKCFAYFQTTVSVFCLDIVNRAKTTNKTFQTITSNDKSLKKHILRNDKTKYLK